MPVTHNPSPKGVSDVVSNLLQPSLTSHFDVLIGLPSSSLGTQLRRFLGPNQDKLHLMCSEAVLPGSSLATTEMNNDFTGVTERHAYRRIYDETIDLSFYVDAQNHLPIRFFEEWISAAVNEDQEAALAKDYFYRVKFPDDYIADQGLKVVKFEKDIQTKRKINNQFISLPNPSASSLEYQFVRSFPRSITSMPVTYDSSSLLKCSVQMTYTRYVISRSTGGSTGGGVFNPFQQSQFNAGGFLSNTAATLVDAAVDRATGSDFVGDLAGNLAGRLVGNLF
tara:strand:- start:34 stop:873 length:840 start_codon:yes stop_codon:yes gene_type:complete